MTMRGGVAPTTTITINYTLLYLHYFALLTRIGIENPIINHKSVLSSSTPADKLSQAELPGTLEWLIKLWLT